MQRHGRSGSCGSRCLASRRPGRTPRGRAAVTWRRSRAPTSSWTAATVSFPSCAGSVTTSTSMQWSSPTCTPTISWTWFRSAMRCATPHSSSRCPWAVGRGPRIPSRRAFAVELPRDASRFTYGADCRPNDQLVRFAADTDVLLIEATLPRPERDGTRGHLTAHEAGEHGRRAGARRLVLPHHSHELDPELIRAEAADGFGRPVDMAVEGAVYTVSGDYA